MIFKKLNKLNKKPGILKTQPRIFIDKNLSKSLQKNNKIPFIELFFILYFEIFSIFISYLNSPGIQNNSQIILYKPKKTHPYF